MKYNPSEVSKAFDVIKEAMITDSPEDRGSLAHSWHCNIAMMCVDAIRDTEMGHNVKYEAIHDVGNDAASRFMKLCFGVETKA
ncbi:hypothetical protein KAI46_10290 [bacterium]|nr:hypothetical protein [bacterium]